MRELGVGCSELAHLELLASVRDLSPDTSRIGLTMLDGRRLIRIALLASVLVAVLVTSGAAQRPRRMAIGVGLGRTFPLEPLAQAAGLPDYELHNASATSVNVDFWWRSWFGTRFAYQWSRADVEKPDVASF